MWFSSRRRAPRNSPSSVLRLEGADRFLEPLTDEETAILTDLLMRLSANRQEPGV